MFLDGMALYETRGDGVSSTPPAWVELSDFAGELIVDDGQSIRVAVVSDRDVEPLSSWLRSELVPGK